MSDPKNLRTEERKKFHCTAKILRRDCPILSGRTLDISVLGISVVLNERLEPGDGCIITFETSLSGKHFNVTVRANIVYSILSGSSFRTGFTFVPLDSKTDADIRAIMRLLFS